MQEPVTKKMNPSVKRKWVNALRSGKYKKGIHQLRSWDGDSYCCLGVLTDLHIKEKKVRAGWKAKTYSPGKADLPERVRLWAGLKGYDASDPKVKFSGKVGTIDRVRTANLSQINDRTRLSFRQIANIIDKNL